MLDVIHHFQNRLKIAFQFIWLNKIYNPCKFDFNLTRPAPKLAALLLRTFSYLLMMKYKQNKNKTSLVDQALQVPCFAILRCIVWLGLKIAYLKSTHQELSNEVKLVHIEQLELPNLNFLYTEWRTNHQLQNIELF